MILFVKRPIVQGKCVAFCYILCFIGLLKEYWIIQFSSFLSAKLDLRQFLVQNTSITQQNLFNLIIRKEKAVFDLSLILCSFNSSSLGDAYAALAHVSYCVVPQITGFLLGLCWSMVKQDLCVL